MKENKHQNIKTWKTKTTTKGTDKYIILAKNVWVVLKIQEETKNQIILLYIQIHITMEN